MRQKHIPLGEMLIGAGVISKEQLKQALVQQKKSGHLLGVTIIQMGFATEEQVQVALSDHMGVSYVKLKGMDISEDVIKKVPAKFACYYKIMPVAIEGKVLTVAVTNPLDIGILDDIKLVLGCEIMPVLSGERDILDAIKRYYGVGAETVEKIIDQAEKKGASSARSEVKSEAEDMADDASIIKFVNQLLDQAVSERATDIHIEPFQDELRIRYRVDGVLFDASIPPTIKYLHSAIVSRVKIMSSLNIAERRLPQDGRIKLKAANTELDLRVSTVPTSYGESVHIRILSANVLLGLEKLGLFKDDLAVIEDFITKPHGIIFVAGPTGSGKTTTLYACLSRINDSHKNIITIEDPVEYQLRGITQIQVNPKIGLSFANGLRAMLRHDPDIMMVGEVRDVETAEITIRVALTGHLVFSTLHTNDAPGAITRLLDMGIEPYLVSSSTEAVLSQRLVRVICPSCKKKVAIDEQLLKQLKQRNVLVDDFYEGSGCAACKFTGYKGRTAVYEILVMTDNIRDLVLRRASANEIKEQALKDGMRTLFYDGMQKVKKGITTVAEVLRVTEIEQLD
ncbi:MAG: ATPase, T2SS/T4P/T4SS family [Candidatus Omnitrophota bacterium]